MKPLSLAVLLLAPLASAQTCPVADLASNGTVDAALTEADCTVRDYIRGENAVTKADAYRLVIRERLVVRLRMTSDAVDSFVYILDDRGVVRLRDNNSGGGRNSEINVQLPPGTYTVVATVGGSAIGNYQLATTSRTPRVCPLNDLTMGDSLDGELFATSCGMVDLGPWNTGTLPFVRYKVDIQKTQILNVTMTATAFDAYLALYTADGLLIERNDNGGGGTNARIRISLKPGTYTLHATAARAGAGAFRINGALEERRTCQITDIVIGEPVQGQLNRNGCRLLDVLAPEIWEGPVDQYRVEVKERTIAKFRMDSAAVDPYLFLVDSRGNIIAENDDIDRTNFNSEIYISLPPGVYTVWAMDVSGVDGRYTLTVTTEALRSCRPQSIDAPGTVGGSLTANGCRQMDLTPYSTSISPAAVFATKAAQRAVYNFSVASTGSGLTPQLQIYAPTGLPVFIRGPVTQSDILLLPGEYLTVVTSRNTASGEFSLTTTSRDPVACEAAPLEAGKALTGELTSTDCALSELLPLYTLPTKGDLWTYTTETAGNVTADITATGWPPMVFLLDANFIPLDLDVNLGMSVNSRLKWAARPGTYHLLVLTAASSGGEYTIKATPEETAPMQ